MGDFIINHNYGQETAIRMVKKAISGKFAVIKDEGHILKVGAPTAPAKVEILDTEVIVSGKVMSKLFVAGVGNEIKLYFEDNPAGGTAVENKVSTSATGNNSAPQNNNGYTLQDYFDYQEKGINIIKQYKELFDNNIISEDEFNEKKAEILNFIKGIMEK